MPRDPGAYCKFHNRPSTVLCQYNFAKVDGNKKLEFCQETACPLYNANPTPQGTVK